VAALYGVLNRRADVFLKSRDRKFMPPSILCASGDPIQFVPARKRDNNGRRQGFGVPIVDENAGFAIVD